MRPDASHTLLRGGDSAPGLFGHGHTHAQLHRGLQAPQTLPLAATCVFGIEHVSHSSDSEQSQSERETHSCGGAGPWSHGPVTMATNTASFCIQMPLRVGL